MPAGWMPKGLVFRRLVSYKTNVSRLETAKGFTSIAHAGECGGRSDVRWLALEASKGPGFAVAAADGNSLQVNVSRCVFPQLCIRNCLSILLAVRGRRLPAQHLG